MSSTAGRPGPPGPGITNVQISDDASAGTVFGHVDGDVHVATNMGDYAMAIMADRVTVVRPAQRPRPRSRKQIGLLPKRPAELLGRRTELDQIGRAVAGGRPVVVAGPPGAGKSTLLREAAWLLHSADCPVVFVDVAGRDVGDALQQVFEALYDNAVYRPGPVELKRLLEGRRFRLVVDHLACPSQQWASFLDTVPDAVVVAAVADGDIPAGGELIRLGGLDRDAAGHLLSRCAGTAPGEVDLPAADALWQATRGLPGLLVAAASRGRAGALTLKSAADLPGLLLSGVAGQEREIVTVLALSGAVEVAPQLLAALLRAPVGVEVDDALRLLANLGLVSSSGRGYRLTPGAAGVLPPDLRPGTADAERICDALRAWAVAPQTSSRTVADHAPLINAAIDLAVGGGCPHAAVRLASAVAPVMARSLRTGAWAEVLDCGRAAADEASDEPAQGYLLHESGVCRLVSGEPGAAAGLFAHAAWIWDRLGNTDLAAAARNHLALCETARPPQHQEPPPYNQQPGFPHPPYWPHQGRSPALPLPPGMPPPAQLGHRLVARLIDDGVMLGFLAVIVLSVVMFTTKVGTSAAATVAVIVTAMLTFVVGVFGYEAVLLAGRGTIGKRVMGLRVVAANGQPLTRNQVLGRAAMHPLGTMLCNMFSSGLVALLNAVSCLRDEPHRRCWHDKIANTMVVYGRPPGRRSSSRSSAVTDASMTSVMPPTRPADRRGSKSGVFWLACIIGVLAVIAVIAFMVINIFAGFLGAFPFFDNARPDLVNAGGPPPWTIKGNGYVYEVDSVTRSTSNTGCSSGPSLTINGFVTRTTSNEFTSMSYDVRNQAGFKLSDAGSDTWEGSPTLGQRDPIVLNVCDSTPSATRLKITITDFFNQNAALILQDIPVPAR